MVETVKLVNLDLGNTTDNTTVRPFSDPFIESLQTNPDQTKPEEDNEVGYIGRVEATDNEENEEEVGGGAKEEAIDKYYKEDEEGGVEEGVEA